MPRTPRPIRIEGDVAYVPLTKGYEAVIDAADVPLVEGRNWRALVAKHTVYAMRSGPAPEERGIYLHRFLMGEPEGKEIDHRDGDGLNNRRENLRTASHAENARNRFRTRPSKSGVKGVRPSENGLRWRASIVTDGRRVGLGTYACITAARVAYAKASAELHGEFGRAA